jgi:hypothetical protein
VPEFDVHKYVVSRGLKTEDALGELRALNSYWSNVPEFFGGGYLLQTYIKRLKSYHASKFVYSQSDEINTFLIEEFLWQYGECAIVKHGKNNEYVVGKFMVVSLDFNGYPKKIKIFPVLRTGGSSEPLNRVFTVGKDAIIIRDDRPTYVNNNFVMSPFYVCTEHLTAMMVATNELNKNMIMGRTYMQVPSTTKQSIIERIEKWFRSGKNVLPIAREIGGAMPSKVQMQTFEIRDRSNELINIFNFHYDRLKESLGAESNAMPNKRERQLNQEINMNNVISEGVSNTKLAMREIGLRDLQRVFGVSVTVELRTKQEADEQRLWDELANQQQQGENNGTKNNTRNTGNNSRN